MKKIIIAIVVPLTILFSVTALISSVGAEDKTDTEFDVGRNSAMAAYALATTVACSDVSNNRATAELLALLEHERYVMLERANNLLKYDSPEYAEFVARANMSSLVLQTIMSDDINSGTVDINEHCGIDVMSALLFLLQKENGSEITNLPISAANTVSYSF